MVTLAAGEELELTPVWSSADESVATVSPSGVVAAIAPGTVEIYCAIGDAPASVQIVRVTAALDQAPE